ncbi:MAG: hypothetical protein OXN94_05665 [Chloroflexota bacterium]|nr:hypothetical protein [Chloroflexota bacterium]
MRMLNKLQGALDLLVSIRDLTTMSRNYQWEVQAPSSFYLEAEYAEVNLSRSEDNHLYVSVRLRAAMSWKLATERDDAGAYVVLKRKPLIGNIGRARFHARVPRGIHISLQLENSRLCLQDLGGSLDLPPET